MEEGRLPEGASPAFRRCRLGGKHAYFIGFLDDYSRYVVGLKVLRSQTAEHMLEVYRRAVAEYGVPKEMLSDQGWRGTTRFEAELRKERVHHLKTRLDQPMTLGKIERFWKTIWEEFLGRARITSGSDGPWRRWSRPWAPSGGKNRPAHLGKFNSALTICYNRCSRGDEDCATGGGQPPGARG